MTTHHALFDEHHVLHELKHYLPAQAPLKDFVHHNTLHSFQDLRFDRALHKASELFGYKTLLSLSEYRSLYESKRIREDVLQRVIVQHKGEALASDWTERVLRKPYKTRFLPRVGSLRANWKREQHIDLDSLVHPILFRILCSYLDQGISIWNFPVREKDFLSSMREMEQTSFTSVFRTRAAKDLFLHGDCAIKALLDRLIGSEALYEHYLFDQQFAHSGWSGMVGVVEELPQTLLDARKISLHDLIVFELLLEIDALNYQFGNDWAPMGSWLTQNPGPLFAEIPETELSEVLTIWQEAFEWSYYDQVMAGLELEIRDETPIANKSFQALFCIDDRECSFRRYLEEFDPTCETFGTPGFFGVDCFFQPQDGKYYTKICPVPISPKHLIKEVDAKNKRKQDYHFNKHAHSFHSGWLISQTLGFWAALRLVSNIFKPTMTPAAASSFKHMDHLSKLTIENQQADDKENGLQIGYTIDEMVVRVEGLLKSIGMVDHFATLVYVVGHGASSVNNPHYAAYDCGACCGRAGSVNARALSYMANHPSVRAILIERGITIPDTTQFIGALHDTTRDEVVFFDEASLTPENREKHKKNKVLFDKALDYNAKERSRRFESIDSRASLKRIHEKIRERSVSLFEPRPELNHATNALTIVGRRSLSKGLFLDRRSFLNSYDYRVDPDGQYLFNILKAAAPVCGGINLEYFFSRVDNQQLGAGTKLPHNVMGLIGVANGMDGDLRPGLPHQMIEVHDPVRMFFIIEQYPDLVLDVIKRLYATYEWFINEWVHLAVVDPDTRKFFVFKEGAFTPYLPMMQHVDTISDITPLIETHQEDLPVYLLS
ncbi:YbcC family protein [Spirosoma aerophilum]